MDASPVISPDVLASLPPTVIALIEWQARQIAILTARVAELEAKLGKKPNNSSKPPSTTHPHDKTPSSKPKSGRSRGGQLHRWPICFSTATYSARSSGL